MTRPRKFWIFNGYFASIRAEKLPEMRGSCRGNPRRIRRRSIRGFPLSHSYLRETVLSFSRSRVRRLVTGDQDSLPSKPPGDVVTPLLPDAGSQCRRETQCRQRSFTPIIRGLGATSLWPKSVRTKPFLSQIPSLPHPSLPPRVNILSCFPQSP